MKKIYFAALAMALTACVSNEDLNPVDNYGYIDVKVSNDPVMVTRATPDLSSWTVQAIGEKTYNLKESGTVESGTYSVTASSHPSIDDSYTANDNWGEAFYSANVANVIVTAGSTVPVKLECGKAKNARIKVLFNLVNNFTDYSLTINRGEIPLVFNKSNSLSTTQETERALAYFAPSPLNDKGIIIEESKQSINYTFSYTYNNTKKDDITGSIVIGGPATENVISISSNDNGKITFTVTYDTDFTSGTNQPLTFDALTGEEVTN